MKNSVQKTIAIGMGYVNLVVHNLVSFVLTPLMIAVWGDGSYGLYKIILSLMTYFMLIDAGIKNSVIRFISEYRSKNDRDSARKYVTCVFSFYIIASVILAIVVLIFSKYIPVIYAKSLTKNEISVLLKGLPWVLLYTIGTLYFNCFTALLRGYNKQVLVQSLNISRSIVRFVVILAMLKMEYSVVSVIAADALLAIVFTIFVLGVVFIGLKLPPKMTGITKGFIYGIFSYSGIMLVYTIAHSLFWSIDNFIVGVMTSSVIAAVYIVFAYYYYSKELHFDMKRLYVETVLINLPFIVVLLAVGFLFKLIPIYGWIGLISRVILFTAFYIFAVCVISKDKEMVRVTVKRIVRRK